MAFRQFGFKKYPLPGEDTAMQVLRPGATFMMGGDKNRNTKFSFWNDPNGKDPPTTQQINEELERERWVFEYYEYQIEKSENYPSILRIPYRFIVSLWSP